MTKYIKEKVDDNTMEPSLKKGTVVLVSKLYDDTIRD